MEQKSYINLEYEIILSLLKEKSHIRGLAKTLNTNHMAIFRSLKNLMKLNAVDYIKSGKNNVFFLKKSIESTSIVKISEYYKLIKLLQKYSNLRLLIEEIQKIKEIKLAILFGSYAKETAEENSDIDIYVESESAKIKKKIESLNSRVSVKIGKYDPHNILIKEIQKNHVIIKGIEKYYEKQEIFI